MSMCTALLDKKVLEGFFEGLRFQKEFFKDPHLQIFKCLTMVFLNVSGRTTFPIMPTVCACNVSVQIVEPAEEKRVMSETCGISKGFSVDHLGGF